MDALEEQTIQSILAVDCGSLYTRALLVDIVADEYRFVGSGVAPTTVEAPDADLTIGVYQALADLEATTGRQLVEDGRVVTPQHPDGHGVDVVVATCSAAPAIRLIVAGITQDFSTRAARAAATSTYTHVLDTISVDDSVLAAAADAPTTLQETPRQGVWAAQQLDKLIALGPDVVLLAGGVDGGPVTPLLRMAEVVVQAVGEERRREQEAALVGGSVAPPPLLFFAGNTAALAPLQKALGDTATVISLPNIQPRLHALRPEPVQDALVNLYRQKQLPLLPGLDGLRRWSRREIEPTIHAVGLVTRYISAEYHREVLSADVGAATTAIAIAGGTDGDRYGTVVRGDFGLAQGLPNLLAAVGPDAVLRWLPFAYTAEELEDWALNRALRPWSLAQTARDLAIEHAFAREALRSVLRDLQAGRDLPSATYDLLIGTGGLLANVPRAGQAALILLDALEPTGEGVGSLEIALDSTLLLPALGAIAPVHPGAAAYLFDRDCLVLLDTCVVPLGAPGQHLPAVGPARNGRRPAQGARTQAATAEAAPANAPASPKGPIAVEVTVEYAEAGSLTIEVPYGSIEVIPLRPEQRASLRVKPSAGFRIGADEPGKPVQTKPGEEIKGGQIGLIIDARGRPLTLSADPETRIARLLEWGRAIRAYSPRETFAAEEVPAAPPPILIPAEPAPATGPADFVSTFPATAPTSGGSTSPLFAEMVEPAAAGASPESSAESRRRPGTGGLKLPSVSGGPSTAPLTLPEPGPGAGPATGDRRRTGNTGKLNLPTVGDSSAGRKGTAPLQWPKKDED